MKVGVVTFHSANNYGAVLQTWALQKVLEDLNITTGVINYHPDIIDGLYDPMKLKRGLPRRLLKMKLYIRNRKSLIRYNKFQSFLGTKLNLIGDYRTYKELEAANLNLDAYIVGSDQVWNPTHIGGFDPAYYLEFAEPASKRISYAASLGTDYVVPKHKNAMEKALNSFTSISVRERSIQNEISELAGKPVEVVLDPTLLLDKDDYDEIKVKSKYKEPYILVYSIEKNPQLMEFANKISVSLGMPILQRRPMNGLINQMEPFYTSDAGEFLGHIEAAKYVITNSFHGTVFSILYGKPFVSMLHTDTGRRTEDLLKDLGMSSHILYDIKDFDSFDIFKIDNIEETKEKIMRLRENSMSFLKASLGI
ncbi:MAG: polysaccharide pyruvyl transferase family protein [Anaerolineaceae bacterium]|nr:MAG: polysaccharide pyruvyl transferase family protein [Anaerolineaceae bacterium]